MLWNPDFELASLLSLVFSFKSNAALLPIAYPFGSDPVVAKKATPDHQQLRGGETDAGTDWIRQRGVEAEGEGVGCCSRGTAEEVGGQGEEIQNHWPNRSYQGLVEVR